MNALVLNVATAMVLLVGRTSHRMIDGLAQRATSDRGQSVTEYALLLIGVAAIAALVLKWVGGTDMIGKLFSSVLDKIIGGVG